MDPSRITLRPFTPDDADDLLSWAGDDRVTRNLTWDTLTSKEEAITFIQQVCIPHPWRRCICIDNRSIGFVSVWPGSQDQRCRGDIGYAIGFEYWGQGIATIAVKMAIPQVLKTFPEIVRLQAFVKVENKASQRVLEKAGFTKEGLLRKYMYLKGNILDLFLFSILSRVDD
ncbi:LOW QUALITY PROTEIN: uncharacterized protein LOC142544986 [Primulina tabacum]|uniref:LOW QUALITY PROTEIN: uncharacterized protein LOC142544986 n=1 Tax=Primulina tabacum TaxID=48773 RepID=UPI003F59AD08